MDIAGGGKWARGHGERTWMWRAGWGGEGGHEGPGNGSE